MVPEQFSTHRRELLKHGTENPCFVGTLWWGSDATAALPLLIAILGSRDPTGALPSPAFTGRPFRPGALGFVAVVLTGVFAAHIALDLAQVRILELGHETSGKDATGNGYQGHRENMMMEPTMRPAGVMGTKSP